MYKYKIKKQFKILDFSGKKIYLEKGASDSIFEISDTMEELLFLLKDGITLEEIYKYFLKQYAVNDEYLNEYAADGVMVATPTGSTAYNLSAGGPVMAPAGRMMAVTPVCSHTLNARSIVISEEDRVKIGLLGKGLVTFDGDTSQKTGPGDYLIVERSHMETVMVKLKQISFMQNLSNYLGNV